MTVSNLLCGKVYYFALVTADEASNVSSISNVAKAKTARCNKLKITPLKLPAGEVGLAYNSGTFAVMGGDAPYTVQIDPALLPPGISYAAQAFTGTPATAKNFVIPAVITDAVGSVRKAKFKIKVADPVAITTSALKPAKANVKYSATPQAKYGLKDYAWTATLNGTLPGVGSTFAFDPDTGKIAVMATAAGSVDVVFQVTDAAGGTDTETLRLTIN
jgi:hypothetical protein